MITPADTITTNTTTAITIVVAGVADFRASCAVASLCTASKLPQYVSPPTVGQKLVASPTSLFKTSKALELSTAMTTLFLLVTICVTSVGVTARRRFPKRRFSTADIQAAAFVLLMIAP